MTINTITFYHFCNVLNLFSMFLKLKRRMWNLFNPPPSRYRQLFWYLHMDLLPIHHGIQHMLKNVAKWNYHTIIKRWMLHKDLEELNAAKTLNFEPRLLCLQPSFIVYPQEIEEVCLATSYTTENNNIHGMATPQPYLLHTVLLGQCFL